MAGFVRKIGGWSKNGVKNEIYRISAFIYYKLVSTREMAQGCSWRLEAPLFLPNRLLIRFTIPDLVKYYASFRGGTANKRGGTANKRGGTANKKGGTNIGSHILYLTEAGILVRVFFFCF